MVLAWTTFCTFAAEMTKIYTALLLLVWGAPSAWAQYVYYDFADTTVSTNLGFADVTSTTTALQTCASPCCAIRVRRLRFRSFMFLPLTVPRFRLRAKSAERTTTQTALLLGIRYRAPRLFGKALQRRLFWATWTTGLAASTTLLCSGRALTTTVLLRCAVT